MKTRKIFAMLLSLVMVIGLMTPAAMADETTTPIDGEEAPTTETTYVAEVGGNQYETLAAAVEAATEGQTVTLLKDVTVDSAVVINKSITLDGDSHAINNTADYVNNASTLSMNSQSNITLKNLKLTAVGNVVRYNYVKEGYTHTYENCQISGGVYGIHYDGNGGKVVIDGCTIDGFNAFAGSLEQVTVKDTTFDANQSSYAGANFWGNTVIENVTLVDEGKTTWLDVKTVAKVTGGKVVQNDTEVSLESYLDAEAKIGTTYYDTLAEAVAAVEDGDTVTLLDAVTASDIIVIDKAITLDGNGKTLTSTANRAINVSGADGATIKNLTIEASGERAINVIQNATNVTIDNVTATAANYTVNVASSAPGAVVAIKNSTLNGLCTVNVASAGANVTVTDSTINCNDNNTAVGESYAALYLNKDATNGKIIATGTTVNVTEGSDSTEGRNGAEGGTVTINGSTEGVDITVAAITYPDSNNYYGFQTLASAVEFASAGNTITLIRDIELTASVTIPENVTLNENGKTISAAAGYTLAVSEDDKTYTVTPIAVTGVTLNNSTLSLTTGGTSTLTATVAPEGALNKTVTWTSSNTSVATVSNGTVTAVAAGTATITVTTADGSKTATCAVTVTAPVAEPDYDDDYYVPVTPSNPTVDKETTENADGSTTTTETKKDGTVIETTENTDGSTVTTESKTEVKETATSTTTTTTTETKTETADGTTETVKVEEKVVETADSTTTTTKTETKTDAKTETVEVVEKVEVDEDGNETTTVTTTTETKLDNGSTGTTNVAADGTVTAEAKVTTTAVTEAAKDEAPVTLPIVAVPVTNKTETASTVEISVPAKEESVTVEIPVENVTPGTVVVLVDEDGNETVVNTTGTTENGVVVNVEGNVTVKVVDNSKDFEDVTSDDWYSDAADFASSRELMNGMTEDTFGHNVPTSRAMVAQILHNMEGKADHDFTGSFNDVDENDWHADAVHWAADQGIISGTGNGNFAPLDYVTREQLAVMLWKYAGSEHSDHYIGHFNDGHKISSYAETAIRWAVENGLMSGKGNGQLDPQGEATRAEVASVLMNFYKNVKY